MRVRHAAMILTAVLGGFTFQSANAIPTAGLPIQNDLGLTEPDNVAYGTGMQLDWSTSGGVGTLHVHGAPTGFNVNLFWPHQTLSNPVFDITAHINLSDNTVTDGSLEVSGAPAPAPTISPATLPVPTVYFYSTDITGFAYSPDTTEFQFLFTQQNKPTTDTTFAALGTSVGVFVDYVIGPGVSPADAPVSFDPGTVSGKAFSFTAPVPEPVTTVLAGLGMGAAAIGAVRRRRA